MENFKEGYYWYKYKSGTYIEYLEANTAIYGFELLQFLGENYSEFQQLFKIKAS